MGQVEGWGRGLGEGEGAGVVGLKGPPIEMGSTRFPRGLMGHLRPSTTPQEQGSPPLGGEGHCQPQLRLSL